MKLRAVSVNDVIAKTGWKNVRGELRVYATLRWCSFVNCIIWFPPEKWETDRASCMSELGLNLQSKLDSVVDRLSNYEEP